MKTAEIRQLPEDEIRAEVQKRRSEIFKLPCARAAMTSRIRVRSGRSAARSDGSSRFCGRSK